MAKKCLNFDKFINEKKAETIEVTIYGKSYEVPAAIPAIVPVTMARVAEIKNADERNAESVKASMVAADALLGKDAVNELCAKGMTFEQLNDLISRLFLMINGQEEKDEEAEEVSDEDSRSSLPGGGAKK